METIDVVDLAGRTVQPRSLPLYERHGVRLVRDHVDSESGLRLLSLSRPPPAARDANEEGTP